MDTIIDLGLRRAAFGTDEPSAAFSPLSFAHVTLAAAEPGMPSPSRRAVVEILHNVGGIVHRALLGGTWTPGPAVGIIVTVGLSGVITRGRPATCSSALGRPLIAGLPDEFAEDVLTGLARTMGHLPPSTLTVDRAAYHETGSSPRAFRLTAELLADVLVALYRGHDIEPLARAAIRSWRPGISAGN